MSGSMIMPWGFEYAVPAITPATALLSDLATRPLAPLLLIAVLAGYIVYGVVIVIYRLLFSPLARFPGPKIAAATAWYEFYYDIVETGRYYQRITEMHDEYGTSNGADSGLLGAHTYRDSTGPIVRINPWELSIRDGDFHKSLYVAGSVRRTEIFPRSRAGIGIDGKTHAATYTHSTQTQFVNHAAGSHPVSSHELHRVRRKPLDPFFARQQVQRYEPMITESLQLLESRLEATRGTGKVINMEHVFAALSGDLIGKISVTEPPSFLSDPEFAPDW